MVAGAIKEIVIGPNSIFQRDKEIGMESVRATNAFKNSADKNAVGFIADQRTDVREAVIHLAKALYC